jgi:hypothetical protein
MRWSFRIGAIAGIQIEVHVTFVLLIGWIAVANGLLAGHPERALVSIATILMVFACVLLHELATPSRPAATASPPATSSCCRSRRGAPAADARQARPGDRGGTRRARREPGDRRHALHRDE